MFPKIVLFYINPICPSFFTKIIFWLEYRGNKTYSKTVLVKGSRVQACSTSTTVLYFLRCSAFFFIFCQNSGVQFEISYYINPIGQSFFTKSIRISCSTTIIVQIRSLQVQFYYKFYSHGILIKNVFNKKGRAYRV